MTGLTLRMKAAHIWSGLRSSLLTVVTGHSAVSSKSARARTPKDANLPPVAFLEGWYVDSDVRRTGVGTELIRAAEAWAVAHGYDEMASDTELENDVSLNAHLALGYEEVERQICFRKRLS